MGPKHSRDDILDGALDAALEDGLSQLTFGRLAKRLGINDRTVVYYFPSKDDLITEVLMAVGTRLQEVLAAAFTKRSGDHLQLAAAAWPILATPEADPMFSLYFEAMGLAAAGREPYRSLTTQLLAAWVEWLSGFFTGTPRQRATSAEATLALLDGLLLMRRLGGPDAAERAAVQLGLRSRRHSAS
jgi:AcrR family transcriptional regulator